MGWFLNVIWSGLNKNQMIKSKYLNKLKHLGISMAIFGYLFKFLSLQGAKFLFTVGLCFVGVYFLIKVFDKDDISN